MARNRWRVYVCSECGELYVYPGVCENRDAHKSRIVNNILKPTTVVAVAQEQNTLSTLQQPQGVRAQAAGEPG